MNRERFIRNYELVITLTSGEVVKIVPEIRVQFEIVKSIRGGLNTAKLRIYNLSEDKRRKLIKDKEDNSIYMPFLFKAGYDKTQTIFKGNVWEAYSERAGADIITTISSLDGGYDFLNSFTSKTIDSRDIVTHLVADMENIQLAKSSKNMTLFRPKVLVGNTYKLIEDLLEENEVCYIDEEKLYILKDDEVLKGYIPVISPSAGLINAPVRKMREVHFKTLLNPAIKIGGMIELKSELAKHLNGRYKVLTVKYSGDNYGTDWTQEITCIAIQNYKAV